MAPDVDPGVRLRRELLSSVLTGASAVLAVFCAVIAVFLAANQLHLKEVDPLTNAALQSLKEASSRHPNDELLKEHFRVLDQGTLAVFYRSQAFFRRGSRLLGGGLVLLLGCLHGVLSLNRRRPRPGRIAEEESQREGRLLRLGVISGSVALLAFTLVVISRPGEPQKLAAGMGSGAGAAAAGALPTAADLAAQWPAFRGYGGMGVALTADVPLQWNGVDGSGVLWKSTPPRPGFSSPIVWQDSVFITGADADARELYCYDAASGNLLWRVDAGGILGSPAELPEVMDDTGYAAPTPATDGVRVYAMFATGDVMGTDLTGTRLWGRNLGVPDNPYGHSSSLLAVEGRLYIQYDHFGKAAVFCLDGATGATLWQQERDVAASWASPLLTPGGPGEAQLILNAEPLVMAYDPFSGSVLWSAECMGGEVGPSPAYADGIAFVTTEYAILAAIRSNGSAAAGEVLWEVDEDLPDVASPVAVGDYLFVATSAGVLTCLGAGSGEVLWRQEFEHGFYSSPLVAGDRLFLTDMRGATRIIRVADEYEELAVCELGEPVVATPAIVSGRLYVRGKKSLFAIGD